MARTFLIAALALTTAFAGGCSFVKYVAYLLAPEPTETVHPEYADLPDNSVAIVIFADHKVQYEYPHARRDLSLKIADELEKNVKGVRVVKPERVLLYQDQDIYWDAHDRTELGRTFNADYVLYVALHEFTTREPGSIQLYQGRIVAEASLYQTCLPERDACVWRNGDLSATYPSSIGVVAGDDRRVLIETVALFADTVAKKFYKHKVDTR